MTDQSHFLLVVRYSDTNESVLVWTPTQIENGRQFTIIATKVKISPMEFSIIKGLSIEELSC